MNIVFKGEHVTVPFCTCGKCLIRRNRDTSSSIKYPYAKNLLSTYGSDYIPKPFGNSAQFFNLSKKDNFKNTYKEHLPSLLMSTMKFDYKPYKIKINPTKEENHKIESIPFWGRSTYTSSFPNWGCSKSKPDNSKGFPQIKVPFRGISNYTENYHNYDDNLRYPPFKPQDNLEFKGNILNDTNFKESYLNPDRSKKYYFSVDKPSKSQKEKSMLIPSDYPKDFNTTYRISYKDESQECQLAIFLKQNGLKHLEL